MYRADRDQAWTKGDPHSRALLDVASDTDPSSHVTVTAGLVELAQRHGLIELMAAYFRGDALIRAVASREKARREILEKNLVRVLGQLHDSGVRTVVLKGPSIAERYAEPNHRPFGDIDLLVESRQLEGALDVLTESSLGGVVPTKRPKAEKRDVTFGDPSGVRFNVDLHWDLFSYSQLRGSADGATETAWHLAEERLDSPWGPMWEIPDAYRIAFLAAHSVLDHRFRLILFRDFLELARHQVDWDAVGQVAQRWGLRSTTYLAWWISRKALGAGVPDDFLSSIRPKSAPIRYLEFALPRNDLVRFDGHRAHPVNLAAVMLNDSPRARFGLLLRAPTALPGWRRRVIADLPIRDHPRTLIVVSTDKRRGAEVFTERLRDGLLEKGWVVEAVSLRETGASPRADVETLVKEGNGGGRFDIDVLRALRDKIKMFRPDVVVANGGATLRYGRLAKVGAGCRLVYMAIGEPQYWIRSDVSRVVNRYLLRGADRILAVSERTREQLIELDPRLGGRVVSAYTGVPEALFKIEGSGSNGPLRVLMVGSLTEEKDPLRALKAVGQVDGSILRFVGEGPLRLDLQREADDLGMGERVEFAGSVPDVTPHLEWADVLILTSRTEGLPGAVLEAGAAGVPAVTVDVGGVKEAVADGESGFVVKDDEGLVESLSTLDHDRFRLERMGLAARRHIASRFLIEDIIDRYARLLTEVWR